MNAVNVFSIAHVTEKGSARSGTQPSPSATAGRQCARPTEWSFPLGTNYEAFSSFWYFVDGRIRPAPRDAAREICAVGAPMSAVPGQSRLWMSVEPDGARVITWDNFFLGGDTNCPVNAQIRLYANGDFTTRSNDVETVCRRINPDDWDGDEWFNDNGMGDYLGRVDSAHNPTVWCYNQVNDGTGMGAVATWHGLPVRMAKVSNFMVGYATTRLGVWQFGRNLAQSIGTENDASAQMSWDAGVDVAHGTNYAFAVGNFVTNAWSVSDAKVKALWPNPATADNHTVRNVVTNFNNQFISPGFIEKGRTP